MIRRRQEGLTWYGSFVLGFEVYEARVRA